VGDSITASKVVRGFEACDQIPQLEVAGREPRRSAAEHGDGLAEGADLDRLPPARRGQDLEL
jgi:hypothetical protein